MKIVQINNYGEVSVRHVDFQYEAAGMVLTVKAGAFTWQGRDSEGNPLPWLQDGAQGMVFQLEDDEHITVDVHAGRQIVSGHLVRDVATGLYHVMSHVFLSPTDPPLSAPIAGYDLLCELFMLDVPAAATDLSGATLRVTRQVAQP